MVKTYKYNFADLNITVKDIGILMGYEEGEIPEPFPVMIEEGLQKAPELCEIQGGYRIFFDVEVNRPEKIIRINDTKFHPGKIVTTQLRKSSQAALFICTAGKGISDYSKKLMKENQLMEGYVLDVIGSVTVEKAMDLIEVDLLLEMQKQGLGITDRYSPGYCNWSVGEQQKLFALMPENFCEVTLSDSSLMDPVKSVSGIIGIGEDLKQKGYQCNWCNDKNCIYGNIRRRSAIY
ncbi:MAG: hypothetical protein JXR31_08130 [Prolixibacteraceae bacterium]|nr:hypothetical protein [Prolixibacteraceae bacterium]MBN2774202.1 hypothetical protein [Prolixibacteraceae bacterium]